MPDTDHKHKHKLKLDPTRIEYWISEAHKLKHAADLCWEADLSLLQDTELARRYGVEEALIKAADDAELELHWLYPNLITFAIQHLAIGILLKRDPQSIIDEGARFQIPKAVRDCGVEIDAATSEVLSNVENAYRWGEQSSPWNVHLSEEQFHSLKKQKPYVLEISEPQKLAFDALYGKLANIAAQEVETNTTATTELGNQNNQ
jgi:hypothetical protein